MGRVMRSKRLLLWLLSAFFFSSNLIAMDWECWASIARLDTEATSLPEIAMRSGLEYFVARTATVETLLRALAQKRQDIRLPHPEWPTFDEDIPQVTHLYPVPMSRIGTPTAALATGIEQFLTTQSSSPAEAGTVDTRLVQRTVLNEVLVVIDPFVLSSGPWRTVHARSHLFRRGHSRALNNAISDQSSSKRIRGFFVDTTVSFVDGAAETVTDTFAIELDANLSSAHIVALLVHPGLREWLTEIVERTLPADRRALPIIEYNSRFIRLKLPERVQPPPAETAAAEGIAAQVQDLSQQYLAASHDVKTALSGLFQSALDVPAAEARALADGALRFGHNMPFEVAWYFRYSNDHFANDTDRQRGLERLQRWIVGHPPK